MGPNRELKKALESYWAGKTSADDLLAVGKNIRKDNWQLQKTQGADIIPSNDFAFYDQVLDHSVLFNAIPPKYQGLALSPLDVMFAMGRGHQKNGIDVPSQEMVKWFDSNYHYMRPEVSQATEFKLTSSKPVDMFNEAKALGIKTRPVLLGPVSFLYLSKAAADSTVEPIDLLSKLVPVYVELLNKLAEAGADWVQIDEPIVVYDLPQKIQDAFAPAYEALSKANVKILFTTYFGDVGPYLPIVSKLPVAGIHFDLVRAAGQLDEALSAVGDDKVISLGLVDGRNIWRTNFKKAFASIETAVQKLGSDRVIVATSSSLLHTPHTLESETKLDAEIKQWFAFAKEKVKEVAVLATAAKDGPATVRADFEANEAAHEARVNSSITYDPAVRDRVKAVKPEDYTRPSPFPERRAAQKELNLPEFPTTTIGSFPQTKEIRVQRNKYTKGEITKEQYEKFIEKEIEHVVRIQEEIGLDVLVHGEPERNDMVQYFGEQMKGFTFTQNGWVQSYGSRCVRPPIVVGDVSRPHAMTVKESKYAQSVTKKPMKGMLTGPVTIIRWSFPRDDVSQDVQLVQVGLAIRDEVKDLEAAGINVIQVDEPALREGLPLRRKDWDPYLESAVNSFRLSTAIAQNKTQVHSHFCYSDFNDIFPSIQALDADVISIEASKSDLKLVRAFKTYGYTSWVGPGVYDIHSPRVPSLEEIKERLGEFLSVVKPDLLWVNPDCGLKTRGWDETRRSLVNMVEAAKYLRAKYQK